MFPMIRVPLREVFGFYSRRMESWRTLLKVGGVLSDISLRTNHNKGPDIAAFNHSETNTVEKLRSLLDPWRFCIR